MFRAFTASKYHHQSVDVYITEANPHILTVTRMGIKWGDFFTTLPMKLTRDCLTTGSGEIFCSNETKVLKFYLNGERVEDALAREIQPGDMLLVSFGVEGAAQIQKQLQKLAELSTK